MWLSVYIYIYMNECMHVRAHMHTHTIFLSIILNIRNKHLWFIIKCIHLNINDDKLFHLP